MSRAQVVHTGWSRFPIHAPPIKVPFWRKNSFLPDTLSGRWAGRNHPPRDRVECGEIPTATNSRPLAMRETAAMKTFVFKTTIDAVVRVQAADEDSARKVAPTVLGAPATADIRIANENIKRRFRQRCRDRGYRV